MSGLTGLTGSSLGNQLDERLVDIAPPEKPVPSRPSVVIVHGALSRKRAQEAVCAPLYAPDGIHTSAKGSDAIAAAVHGALGPCVNRTGLH